MTDEDKAMIARLLMPGGVDDETCIAAADRIEALVDAIAALPAVVLTPNLDALAMQRAAAGVVADELVGTVYLSKLTQCTQRLYALPAPTPADALAEAMRLPEVKALVEALRLIQSTYALPPRFQVPVDAALAALPKGDA